jgi:hypothetical protein
MSGSNNDIKLVLVGDNPGNEEKKSNVFLSPNGRAGKAARKFFKLVHGDDCFSSRILILNKSSYHTTNTKDLTPIKDETWFKEDLERNAELIGAFSKCDIQVLILGFSELDGIFRSFNDTLKSCQNASMVKTVPHFSFSSIFQKNSNESWNDSIESFLINHPELSTGNDNVSWAKMQKLPADERHAICKEYLETVILK